MTVKGSATITLTQYRDTQSVTRYYILTTAGSSAPSKPTTKPPSSDWSDSEPACDISKTLYFCDLTIFSNGEWEYSAVSKSSSYEAAKEAYNKAQSAQDGIDNLEIGGRNLLLDSNGTGRLKDPSSYCCASYYISEYEPLKSGYDYTITINFTASEERKGILPYVGGGSYPIGVWRSIELDGTYTYSWQFTATDNMASASQFINVYSSTTGIYQGSTSISGTCYINWIKLEKGNKATDWTPAPEDVDAGISNAQETADSIASNIYVPDSTLLDGSKISDGSLSINQMDDTVAGTYSDPTTKKGIMEWNGDALHIKSIDANAQNTYETVIGGDGIKFNWNGVETASINQDELRINKTVVINAMEVGNWSWAIHPTTGNLMVKWNGGDS